VGSPDAKRLARELGAHYLLTGSIAQTGERLRLIIRLIDATNDFHVWGDTYDGDVGDLFGLQDRVTEGVMRAILPQIRGAEIERRQNVPAFRVAAYNDFSSTLKEKQDHIAELEKDIAGYAKNIGDHKVQLQQLLRDAYPGVSIEVINAAVGGYTSAENLRNLKYRVLPLDPDLVIYYEANNEIVKDTREIAVRKGISAQRQAPPLVAAINARSCRLVAVFG